ncbi:MAG: glycosyltransferase [Bacteroidetes bacterium]|nr:glycosyltransferase [Bacteroidota bacterium]
MNLSIILPTYNECDAINALISEIYEMLEAHRFAFEIIVVDDNSPDGTFIKVSEKWKGNPRIRPILREKEKGLATAILHGIRKSEGDKVIIMDTDFNHPPKLIPLLVNITDYFEIASCSRYVIGGGMETSRFRFFGSKIFNKFIHYTLKMQTTDNLSGYYCFRKEVLDGLPVERIFFGYGDYYIRFLYVMQRLKHPIIEIPVVYKDRLGGLSKTNLKNEFFRYFNTVLRIKFGLWKLK